MRLTTLLAAGFVALAGPALAVPMGDDGLHKPDWLRETFRDMREDLAEAAAGNRRMLVIWEQRGCIYCTRMHEEVFPDPGIGALIREHYFVVQMNLFGDVEVTDFDGTVLTEKEMARRWGVMFTPTMMFMPETAPEGGTTAAQAAVVTMPGAFGKGTTRALLQWVLDRGYEGDEHFQKYLARTMADPGN
ncbi:thioredoxin family protein [Rhodovulum sp. MB263]|uniref:thioredoxin family protein n=1 Tax=Rhodovulum sp. (strain MB263) TaxID=308754 RepID=UPI0009B7BBCA|nr:thioredoxin family protein [Rhodovulum sp. MB263]ARC89147.1 thioredoxin [Rhodovulum sp. MB263]